jgi:anion-transporting  ArsA/GET3 family ATPase
VSNLKKLEIFCGTGGVGKTTLAASRALYLATTGLRVLLITIDPSKRLKQVFNIDDSHAGMVRSATLKEVPTLSFLLMSPPHAMERILKKSNRSLNQENHIINVLSKPFGGMNEIFSLVEVHEHLNSGLFDVVVLDTAPGKHFLDFLGAYKRLQLFFNKTFMDIFEYLGKSTTTLTTETKAGKIFGQLVKTGVNKLLSYLESVTGKNFIEEFIQAITTIYQCKDSFMESSKLSEELAEGKLAKWYLVTSAEQSKFKEALEMQKLINSKIKGDSFFVVNKSMRENLEDWTPETKLLQTYKESLLYKEQELLKDAQSYFTNILYFPDILESEPLEQVKALGKRWTTR